MKFFMISAVAALLAGCATSEAPAPSATADETLRVVETDARITLSSSTIDSFSAGPDQSMLISTYGGGLYRVMLQPPCRGEARFTERAAIEAGGSDTFDKFSKIRLNGRVCSVASIDRVERVKPS
jgi:Family of unknown function (DUF6491)